MIYNASAQRMKREDERNQADGGAQARQADIAFPAQPLAAADKPAQPAQTAAERSAAPAGLFSPAPAAPDNKQKKAASLIGDLSHPDFMKPIRETAGAAAGKKPAAAYVGYDFTKMLQEALDALGADLAVDGVFGPKTQAAYDDFQRGGQSALRARALPVPAQSGALQTGQNIRTRLNAIPELTKKQKEGAALVYDLSHPDFMNAVKKSAGTDAKAAAKNGGNYTFTHMLQSELNAAGYPFVTKGPLKVDGVFGPKTQAAYEEFFKNAPRLLGEGGAQATLSAARTPSADPAMRVSPDTEIIPVEIPEEPVTRFLPGKNPIVAPQEASSDYVVNAARRAADKILNEIVSEYHPSVKGMRDWGLWSVKDMLYVTKLERDLNLTNLWADRINGFVFDLISTALSGGSSAISPSDVSAYAFSKKIIINDPQMIANAANLLMDQLEPGMNVDGYRGSLMPSNLIGLDKRCSIIRQQINYLYDSGYAYLTVFENSHREEFISFLKDAIDDIKRNPIKRYRVASQNKKYNNELIASLQRIIDMNCNHAENSAAMKQQLELIKDRYQ